MANAAELTVPVTICFPEFEPNFGCIGRYLERTKSYSPLRLIVELTLVDLTMQFLITNMLALSPWGASYAKFAHAQKAIAMMPGFWVLAILVAPVMETLQLQCIPVKFMSLFTSRPGALAVGSAIVFAATHMNPFHAIAVFPAGLILGWVYVMKKDESFKSAFCLTAVIHMLHNAVAVGGMWLS